MGVETFKHRRRDTWSGSFTADVASCFKTFAPASKSVTLTRRVDRMGSDAVLPRTGLISTGAGVDRG